VERQITRIPTHDAQATNAASSKRLFADEEIPVRDVLRFSQLQQPRTNHRVRVNATNSETR